MLFIIALALGIALGNLVTVIAFGVIMAQPKFIKWYMKYVTNCMKHLDEALEDSND